MYKLQKFDDNDNPIDAPFDLMSSYRIAVYVKRNFKKHRTVVELQGFMLTALCSKLNVEKVNMPKTIQGLIDGWQGFDGSYNVTKQVNALIVNALM